MTVAVLVACSVFFLAILLFAGVDWIRERRFQKRSKGDMFYKER